MPNNWCEHIYKKSSPYEKGKEAWFFNYLPYGQVIFAHEWNFCPICGAERPKEVDLVEELANELFRKHASDNYTCSQAWWDLLAKSCFSFLREKGMLK